MQPSAENFLSQEYSQQAILHRNINVHESCVIVKTRSSQQREEKC